MLLWVNGASILKLREKELAKGNTWLYNWLKILEHREHGDILTSNSVTSGECKCVVVAKRIKLQLQ